MTISESYTDLRQQKQLNITSLIKPSLTRFSEILKIDSGRLSEAFREKNQSTGISTIRSAFSAES
jgi:hypothetical protein